jgi:hypothetical protein
MALDDEPADNAEMEIDSKLSKMLSKDKDSIAIKKKKRGKRGNKRTLVY